MNAIRHATSRLIFKAFRREKEIETRCDSRREFLNSFPFFFCLQISQKEKKKKKIVNIQNKTRRSWAQLRIPNGWWIDGAGRTGWKSSPNNNHFKKQNKCRWFATGRKFNASRHETKEEEKKIKRRPRIYSCVCVCVLSPTPPLQNKNERPCVDSFQFPTLAKQKQMQNDEIPSSSSATFAHFGNRQRGGLSVLYARLSILVFFLSIYTHTRADTNTHTHEITCVSESKEMGGAASWVAIEELEENPKAMLVRKDSARDGWKHVGFLLYTYKQHTPCTKSNGTSRWWCPAEPGKATKTHKNKWRGRETF